MTNFQKIASLIQRETRPVDLGGFADASAGETLECWVNAPAVSEILDRRKPGDYTSYRQVVGLLFDFTPEQVAGFSDDFLLWLFVTGVATYTEYQASLKKK